MGHYNFGFKIMDGTTMSWAENRILPNSTVLEIGPAIGCLTKALHEKGCQVDIIEIDPEAGASASRFSRQALIGPQNGDIAGSYWKAKLKDNEYDYIIFLDVLEHLSDPLAVLLSVKGKLAKNGKILISVPNIAHNDVIIQLWKDAFHYTDTGLLDRTHIHFFTLSTIREMLRQAGLGILQENIITKTVGETESGVQYSEVDMDIERALKRRVNGNSYQYLFEVSTSGQWNILLPERNIRQEGVDLYLYTKIFGRTEYSDKNAITAKVYIDQFNATFDLPFCARNRNIMLKIKLDNILIQEPFFQWETNNRRKTRVPYKTSGKALRRGFILFANANCHLFAILPAKVQKVMFSCKVIGYNDNALAKLHEMY